MYNNLNIGQNAVGIFAAPAFAPISRIALLVDDENEYLSGDDSGRTLEVTCPYGSQAMADDLLAQLKGYAYQPMTAQDALLDPAAEIGDGVTVGGVSTILAQIDTLFDMHCAADIAAPGEEELESEYAFQTQEKRLERKLAQTRSLIEKTAEQVRISVEGVEGQIADFSVSLDSISAEMRGLEGEYAALALTLEGLTVSGPSGTTLIAGNMIDTSTLNVDNINIDLTGSIKWTDLSEAVQDEIDTALGYADEALGLAEDTADTVSGWAYNGGTYIDGAMIKAGTVMASMLIGGEVALLTSKEREAGGMEITGSSSSSYAVELYSNGALRLNAYNGAAYIGSDDGASIEVSNRIWMNDHMYPSSPDEYNCGNANYPWAMVYSTNGMCETSDRKKKKDIEYGLDRFDGFFDDLQASSYRMVNGTSGRRHNGFVADDVKANLDKHGISTKDFGGYVADVDKDGNEILGLRYSEFIPLLVDQVQKLKARVTKMEEKK